MARMLRKPAFLAFISVATRLFLGASIPAVASAQTTAHAATRATVLHVANVYAVADAADPPVATINPGRELVVNQKNDPWVNVFGNTDDKDENADEKPEFTDPNQQTHPAAGWIRDKGIVGPQTPDGDRLLYGAAAEFETRASEVHGPKGAADAAGLLYRRTWEYFPQSPLAPEAAFRSADIRWQLEKLDNSTLPSAHEQDATLRPQLYEGALKRVMKSYPNSPASAKAAFDLIDNKVCGDWQGLPKCPEMESELYAKYADRFPNGPKSAEALFNAVYRQGALVTLYQVAENRKRSEHAAQACHGLADRLRTEYPASDFAARAAAIDYRVQQGIPVYGSDRD